MAAIEALGCAGTGIEALRERLRSEPLDFVIAEICDALAAIGDSEVVPDLKRLAVEHPSELARTYAAKALMDIQGEGTREFLTGRLQDERSFRARSTLATLLLYLGVQACEERVLRALKAKDYIVRSRVIHLISEYFSDVPDRLRQEVSRLARQDPTRAVRDVASRLLAQIADS
jgi:HEAT repeat protein